MPDPKIQRSTRNKQSSVRYLALIHSRLLPGLVHSCRRSEVNMNMNNSTRYQYTTQSGSFLPKEGNTTYTYAPACMVPAYLKEIVMEVTSPTMVSGEDTTPKCIEDSRNPPVNPLEKSGMTKKNKKTRMFSKGVKECSYRLVVLIGPEFLQPAQ